MARNLMLDFMQGYKFVDDINRQKQSDQERQEDRAFNRKAAQRGLDIQEAQNKRAAQKQQWAASDRDKEQKLNRLNGILTGLEGGAVPSEQDIQWLHDDVGLDLAALATPEHGQNFAIIKNALDGKFGSARQTLQNPQVLEAVNNLYAPRIKRGIGEKLPSGDVIIDKRISGLYGTKDGKGLLADLTVSARRPDGTTYEYQAPRTDGASADQQDNMVRVTPLEDLVGNFAAQTQIFAGLQRLPAAIKAKIIGLGGKLKERSFGGKFTDREGNVVVYDETDPSRRMNIGQTTPEEVKGSSLKKLLAERDALPEGDPRREIYNKAIDKETTRSTLTASDVMVDTLAQQVMEGRLDPNMISKRGGLQQAVFSKVEELAPGFDIIGAHANARFTSNSGNLQSRALANAVLPLYDSLLETGKALGNSNLPGINRVKNWIKEQTGDPGITSFNNLRDDIVAETERILLGSGVLSDSKYQRALGNINSAQSLPQLEAAVKQMKKVVKTRLDALDMRPFPTLYPGQQEAGQQAGSATTQPAGSPQQQGGNKLSRNPDGSWTYRP